MESGPSSHEDGQSSGDSIRRMFKVVVNILKPSIRILLESLIDDQHMQLSLKLVDDMIQLLVDQQDSDQLPSSKTLMKNIAQYIKEMFFDVSARGTTFMTPRSREQVVCFIDSIIQVLRYIFSDEYVEEEDSIYPFGIIKNEIKDFHDDLKFLRNFLRIIENEDVSDHFISAQFIAEYFSVSFCYFFVLVVIVDDDKEFVSEKVNDLVLGLYPEIKDKIHTLVSKFQGYHEPGKLSVLLGDIDTPSNIIDEQVVGFFDFLINKLREQQISSDDNAAASFSGQHMKDLMDTAINQLSFLRSNLFDIIQVYSQEDSVVKEMESLSVRTLALIIKTGYLIYFSRPHVEEKEGETTTIDNYYWSFHLPYLLEAIDSLKQQVSDLYSNNFSSLSLSNKLPSSPSTSTNSSISTSNGTSTNHMKSVNFFCERIQDLMVASSIPLKHQIEALCQEMVPMREIAKGQLGNPQMGFIKTLFEQVANDCNFIIDSLLAQEGSLWHHMLGMFVVSNQVKMINKEMKSELKKMKNFGATDLAAEVISPAIDIDAADKVVGIKDAAKEVMELLTGGETKLKIISIVGMPGLGKTTLARSLYEQPSLRICFHVSAWCCVSQVYEKETLLGEILSHIVCKNNLSHENVEGEDFSQKLYQNLKGRKYLIVIDDIWDVDVWNDLNRIFPDDNIGSRILFTTRHRYVAKEANSVVYNLRLLSEVESCKLLWLNIFGGEIFPPELSIISTQIARYCKGLPLALVLISGVLKMTGKRKEYWEEVARKMSDLRRKGLESINYLRKRAAWSEAFSGNHLEVLELTNILELSYQHLPSYLKRCFLYLGAYPEDSPISVSKLIRLWISEGFLHEENVCQNNSIEEEAESYLEELIDRSLVMIAKRSSSGGVKACSIHDVLRDFCSAKCQQDGLLGKRQEDGLLLPEESMFGGVIFVHFQSLTYYHTTDPTTSSEQRQPNSERQMLIEKLDTGTPVSDRRGQHNARTNFLRRLDRNFILRHQFLNMLDLGKVRFENSAKTSDLIMISELENLRYLAIRPRTAKIPSEIGNLRNLEFLVLTGAIGNIKLPESLWNLSSLRHVLADHGFFDFRNCSKNFFDNSQLDQLKSISSISLWHTDEAGKSILRKLTNIQKLGLKFSSAKSTLRKTTKIPEIAFNCFANAGDDSTCCNIFPKLDFLSELKSLKVFISGKMVLSPCKFSFPSNLKKLSMSNSRLPWDEISVIGRQLPNLEVLKLLNKAFEGQEWNMGDDEFQKLKFLKLDSLDIGVWNVYAEHLPCLEQLVVLSCPQLKKLPSFFGELSTLQSIEMKWCSSSAIDSVKQILEEQRDYYPQFKVNIVGSASYIFSLSG